jgi:hypothetical protein
MRPVLKSLVECPPITSVPTYHFIRINPGTKKRLRVLDASVYGVNTHWTRQESQFCTRFTGECVWCEAHAALKWDGYLMVEAPKVLTQHVLHITKGCFQYSERMQPGQPSLVNLEIIAWRRGTKVNSPLCSAFEEHPWETPFPHVPDIRDVLERVFNLKPGTLPRGGAD